MDGGRPQCSLTVKAASQICQCNFVCTLRFCCEECGKRFNENDDFRKHKASVHQGQCNFVCAFLFWLCFVIATDGGRPQCSLTVKAASQICQCNFVCTWRFYCEECGKRFNKIMISGNLKPVFIRVRQFCGCISVLAMLCHSHGWRETSMQCNC